MLLMSVEFTLKYCIHSFLLCKKTTTIKSMKWTTFCDRSETDPSPTYVNHYSSDSHFKTQHILSPIIHIYIIFYLLCKVLIKSAIKRSYVMMITSLFLALSSHRFHCIVEFSMPLAKRCTSWPWTLWKECHIRNHSNEKMQSFWFEIPKLPLDIIMPYFWSDAKGFKFPVLSVFSEHSVAARLWISSFDSKKTEAGQWDVYQDPVSVKERTGNPGEQRSLLISLFRGKCKRII